jgi:hypothetical protein
MIPLQAVVIALVALGGAAVALVRNPLRQAVVNGFYGLALIVLFVALVLARRPAYPAALAAFSAWALHAAVDWDWQLPGATLPALLAGAALLPRSELRLATGLAAGALLVVAGGALIGAAR